MLHRFLLCVFVFALVVSLASVAQPAEDYSRADDSWNWSSSSDEGTGGSSYLGVDIADVSAERLGELKLKEEHGAEITMVDQDAPAGKAGLHEHDVILSVNGTAVESTAQLRRMIKETPPGRVVSLGISRDGQPMTIKVQLADRHKTMSWEPQVHVEIPHIPEVPALPDFDLPVSVMIVHQSARSGLMVENLSPQLGEYFGAKDGKGVLVRSVEKGSRGEKAGFRAGDVVVKVNNEPVHDTSDFTHALRSSSTGSVGVTVLRERKEQNLKLLLPEKKDSGTLQENTFDIHNFTAQTEEAMSHADELADLGPAIMENAEDWADRWQEMQDNLRERQREWKEQEEERQAEIQDRMREMQEGRQDREQEMKERQEEIQKQTEEMQERQKEFQKRSQELREQQHHGLSRQWADI
jgi:serine protease Do